MGTRFIKNKALAFLFQCLSLGSPLARVVTFSIGISILAFIDISSLELPNLCIWERLFDYCPANGSTRALNAFFHGKSEEAIKYNLNIIIIIPIILTLIFRDIFRLSAKIWHDKIAGTDVVKQ